MVCCMNPLIHSQEQHESIGGIYNLYLNVPNEQVYKQNVDCSKKVYKKIFTRDSVTVIKSCINRVVLFILKYLMDIKPSHFNST